MLLACRDQKGAALLAALAQVRRLAGEAGAGLPPPQPAPRGADRRRRWRPDPLAEPPPPSSFPPYAARDYFWFEVLHSSRRPGSAARVGRLHTPHGTVDTPGYVAVGTNAALKAVDAAAADAAGLQLMFANTYHLLLHPGAAVVEAAGGLHAFMGRRDRPLITDSGGFQVFSLAHGSVHQEVTSGGDLGGGAPGGAPPGGASLKRAGGQSRRRDAGAGGSLVGKVTEEGVSFRSFRDGTRMLLTPEGSVAAQKQLGADIILPLDELPPYHIAPGDLAASTARSHRWMARSLRAHLGDVRQQAMYGIVHGGMDLDLRQRSTEYLAALPFDGFAVGGSLGKDREDLLWLMQRVMPGVPRGKPCHVLGIADPGSAAALAALGCDTFDSCYATRAGRHGSLLTAAGNLRVGSGQHKSAFRAPVEGCTCGTCRRYSLAYLHHLVKAREPLAASLLSLHNIHFMCRLMEGLREAILRDEL